MAARGLTPEMMKILEDPQIRGNVDRFTVSRFHNFAKYGGVPERSELLEGMVFTIMPKSALHTNIIRMFMKILNGLVPSGHFLSQESPLTIEAIDSEPEPDIMVCTGSEADFWNENPRTAELVIEIAVTSLNLDRYKARLYATAGVKEYWLLHAQERKLEIFTEPRGGEYTASRIVTGDVVSAILPQIQFKLNEVLPPLPADAPPQTQIAAL